MLASPCDEVGEVLQPSLLPVSDHSAVGVATPCDHNCVRYGVRDGTVVTVISNVINLILTSLHLTLTLYNILERSHAPGTHLV